MSSVFHGSAVLTHDPQLSKTDEGVDSCTVRLVTTDRRYEDGLWIKEPEMTFEMTVYKRMAKNLVESVIKGDQLILIGKLKSDDDGNLIISPNEVGVGLRYHAAIVTKDDEE